MLIDLHIGWYYKYNPEQKPHKGTIMPVCELIDIVETPIGERCVIQVIGDVGTREAYVNELAPMIMVRSAEAANFASIFPVQVEQVEIWRKACERI